MTNCATITITVTMPVETHDLLCRYATRTSGNFDNITSALIMDGIDARAALHPELAAKIGLPPIHRASTIGRILEKPHD